METARLGTCIFFFEGFEFFVVCSFVVCVFLFSLVWFCYCSCMVWTLLLMVFLTDFLNFKHVPLGLYQCSCRLDKDTLGEYYVVARNE